MFSSKQFNLNQYLYFKNLKVHNYFDDEPDCGYHLLLHWYVRHSFQDLGLSLMLKNANYLLISLFYFELKNYEFTLSLLNFVYFNRLFKEYFNYLLIKYHSKSVETLKLDQHRHSLLRFHLEYFYNLY